MSTHNLLVSQTGNIGMRGGIPNVTKSRKYCKYDYLNCTDTTCSKNKQKLPQLLENPPKTSETRLFCSQQRNQIIKKNQRYWNIVLFLLKLERTKYLKIPITVLWLCLTYDAANNLHLDIVKFLKTSQVFSVGSCD